jgi:uncharacterized membrane protein
LHFVNPNYHVILIHYPLGVFMLGLTIELLSFLWKNSSVRTAARWMILLGGLATLPAATSGIYALSSVFDGSAPTVTDRGVQMLRMHVWLQSIATILAVFTAVFALAAADGWRRRFHWFAMTVFAACGGLMVVGSWFAGESVYTQGVAIQATPGDQKATAFSIAADKHGEEKVIYFTGDPIQLHMIGAGVMFAIAMAALGLSIRAITSEYPDAAHLPLLPETSSSDSSDPLRLSSALNPESPAPRFAPPGDGLEDLPVPAARFWLIAAFIAILTLAGGYWLWSTDKDTPSIPEFWAHVMTKGGALKFNHAALHVWLGISLIVLPLLLAMFARWAPRQKTILAIFSLLLIAAISAQVWLGVLLTFR